MMMMMMMMDDDDFAVSVDHRVKIKENEKIDKYIYLTREKRE